MKVWVTAGYSDYTNELTSKINEFTDSGCVDVKNIKYHNVAEGLVIATIFYEDEQR